MHIYHCLNENRQYTCLYATRLSDESNGSDMTEPTDYVRFTGWLYQMYGNYLLYRPKIV